jgi:hypothetical protein
VLGVEGVVQQSSPEPCEVDDSLEQLGLPRKAVDHRPRSRPHQRSIWRGDMGII